MKVALMMIASATAMISTVSGAQMIRPGNWEMVSTPTSIDMPGAPPQMMAMMKNRPMKMTMCITPEQAKLGPQSLAKTAKNCRFNRFGVRGTRISYEMVCNQPTGTMTAFFTDCVFASPSTSVRKSSRRSE